MIARRIALIMFYSICVFGSTGAIAQMKSPNPSPLQNTQLIDSGRIKEIRARLPGSTLGAKLESLLFWSQKERDQNFPLMQDIFPSLDVATGSGIYPLKAGTPIVPVWQDSTTLKSYMAENHIAGVLVLKDDKIRLEAYADGVTKNTVWTSFSMAKSVSSMLLGVALKEGTIKSLDDSLEKYIPELKGYDYGKVTIRQLLTMTSGIQWNEDYADPRSDVAQMYLKPCDGTESHILSYMKSLKFEHKPGTYWHYSTGETDLLGILIQKATGKSLAEYLSEKIWRPWGMAHRAYWLTDECSGLNIGGSGLSATLRDYARLGTIMLENGKQGHLHLFTEEWLKNATAMLHQTDENGGGYGYLWWRSPDGSYRAVGIFGQMIYINPKQNLVITQIAAWPEASSSALVKGRHAFINAVERGLRVK